MERKVPRDKCVGKFYLLRLDSTVHWEETRYELDAYGELTTRGRKVQKLNPTPEEQKAAQAAAAAAAAGPSTSNNVVPVRPEMGPPRKWQLRKNFAIRSARFGNDVNGGIFRYEGDKYRGKSMPTPQYLLLHIPTGFGFDRAKCKEDLDPRTVCDKDLVIVFVNEIEAVQFVDFMNHRVLKVANDPVIWFDNFEDSKKAFDVVVAAYDKIMFQRLARKIKAAGRDDEGTSRKEDKNRPKYQDDEEYDEEFEAGAIKKARIVPGVRSGAEAPNAIAEAKIADGADP